jgi:serine/threonine protein kinase
VAPPPSPAPAAAARPLPTPASRAQAAAGPGQPVQAAATVTVAVAAPVAAPTASAAPAPVPAPAAPARGGHGWWGLAAVPAALLAAAGVLLRRRRRAVPPTSAPTVTGAGAVPAGGPPEPAEGRSYGPYIAKHVLGRGGCATAYYGVHRETGAEVAIKVPHPHLAGDEGFRARFRREASLGALLDHPRVVRIVDPGPAEGDLWLAMAFIRGTTLEAALKGGGAFPVDRAVGIAADIAEAMAYAHGKGVVHRDLKPGNVMLTDQGAVVMDFGIARKLDTSLTASTMFLGTPMYCAPEGLLGPKVGPPADRYSLGVILFEMLAGQPPFQADTVFQLMEAQRSQPLPDLGGIRPYTPPGLIRLVQRLCAKAPEDRPEDLEALAILQGLRT